MVVKYLDNSIECATALKGDNYVHLLDANGDMIAAFDEVSDFSGFKISGGNWTTPTDNHHCYIAVVRDDGTIAKGGHKCSDIQQRDRVANLLDNSWFVNPINQRGQTQYTGMGYTIDRWRTWDDGAVTLNNGYISHEVPIYQTIGVKLDSSKKYTFAVMNTDNVVTIVSGAINNDLWGSGINLAYNNGDSYVRIYADDHVKNIVWAALYEGAYTAETLPPYQYKGYAAELAECMRYFRGETHYALYCYANTYTFGFDLETPMRVAPTVNIKSLYTSNWQEVGGETTASVSNGKRIVQLENDNFVKGNYYRTFIELSADL